MLSVLRRGQMPRTDTESTMGDKNPKSKTKQAAQKNAKSSAASQAKQAAITAKQGPAKK